MSAIRLTRLDELEPSGTQVQAQEKGGLDCLTGACGEQRLRNSQRVSRTIHAAQRMANLSCGNGGKCGKGAGGRCGRTRELNPGHGDFRMFGGQEPNTAGQTGGTTTLLRSQQAAGR